MSKTRRSPVTADNPNAYFDGNYWIYSEGYSPRYYKARNETKKYLKLFYNEIYNIKSKKLKLQELEL